MDIIAGTAGHIDHGKTALIKALTGVDADRLPEEKQRGITIDLGFAELEIGDIRFGFVDVPGHERFVKNMLAGVSGIDLVILVVAADEGVMPQTREHFDICRLLDIKTGLVVLTKKDLADNDSIELVQLQIEELVTGSFLADAPVIAVSGKTGDGLEEVRNALVRVARKIPKRSEFYIPRLAIDRCFSVKGFGTVVTGTLNSGEIREADEMEILPAGEVVRVRGLQTHGSQVKTAHTGQRTAVNLGGIDYTEVVRGMVLAQKNVLRPTQILDTKVELIADAPRPLRSRQRVRVHIGTAEILARISVLNESAEIGPGQSDLVQLRLESTTVAVPGERFILRSYSPQLTISGGVVLDPLAPKHRRRELTQVRTFLMAAEGSLSLPSEQVCLFVESSGEQGMSRSDLNARTALRPEILDAALKDIVDRGDAVSAEGIYVSNADLDGLKTKVIAQIDSHHRREPLSKGISKETLRERIGQHLDSELFKRALTDLERAGKIVADGDSLRAAEHDATLSPDEAVALDRLRKTYSAGLEVPKFTDALTGAAANTKLNSLQTRKVFQLLIDSGEVVKVTDEFYFSRESISAVKEKLAAFASVTADRLIDVPKFKDIAGVSRKYAIPLLEYFDRERVTQRAGDKRLIL